MDIKNLKIGSRNSPLALVQSRIIAKELNAMGYNCTIVEMTTSGDLNLNRALNDIGGKGLFTKELDQALLDGTIDLAVHSMKDLETQISDGLEICAVPERATVRDVFLSRDMRTFNELAQNATIGTASLQRAAQLKYYRPDINIVLFRGNVQTRINKLNQGLADATILAQAGLQRLGLESQIAEIFSEEFMIPAVAQGALAVVCARHQTHIKKILHKINHEPSFFATKIERTLLECLDGLCRTPIAGLALIKGNDIKLSGFLANLAMTKFARAEIIGDKTQGINLAHRLADQLTAKLA